MQLYRGQRVLPWTPPFIINQSSSELTHTKTLEGHCIVLLVPIQRIGCPGAENGEEERPSEAGKPRADALCASSRRGHVPWNSPFSAPTSHLEGRAPAACGRVAAPHACVWGAERCVLAIQSLSLASFSTS